MYIKKGGCLVLGDLKKNWAKYHQGEIFPDDITVTVNKLNDLEKKAIERLRAYMKEFYKMQKQKETAEKKEGD